MNAFDVLGDPVRRRILELLADRELASGQITERIADEFGISQPAVSQHLRVLREHGFANARAAGTRRLYSLEPSGLDPIDQWAESLRRSWERHLDALVTEIARGKRRGRSSA